MERTISGMMGKGSVNHNTRAFSAKNVDKERSRDNVEFCHKDIKAVYHELFDEALERYNEGAINETIDKYSKLLWSIIGKVLNNIGSVQDIEECVADTFIYLWENPHKFDPSRGKLKSWLSIIARTKAIDRCREIAKTRTISLESTILVSDLGIVDDMIQEETRRVLIAAVNALGEPDREILVRRYYYEQKPKEIALALNLSVKQVNNRLYQTKQKLREALSN